MQGVFHPEVVESAENAKVKELFFSRRSQRRDVISRIGNYQKCPFKPLCLFDTLNIVTFKTSNFLCT